MRSRLYNQWLDRRKRQTSECPSPTFTTSNGLEFTTYCGQQFTGEVNTVGKSSEGNSIEDCMGYCSIYRPRCYGVWWDTDDQECYFLNDGLGTSNLTSSSSISIAIADRSQLVEPADTSCPYADGSMQTLANTEEFLIYCDKDFGGYGDYCPDNLQAEGSGCPPHADTLEECMQICSDAHPLCTGVSFNPDLELGYANCYLKSDLDGAVAQAPAEGVATHSAEITAAFADVSVGCPSSRTYTSDNGKDFAVECYDGRVGSDNITSQHETSVEDCLESCSIRTGLGCIGVVFDIELLDGFNNCYLLNETGTPNKGANATFAQLTQQAVDGATPSETNGDGESNEASSAWVAGPVIGVVLLLALIIGGFFWWRRRSEKRQAQLDEQQPTISELPSDHGVWEAKPYAMHKADGPMHEQFHMLQSQERYELADPNSQRALQHELDRH
ncbi:hypothetical protein LTR37_005748 [Vermiconidia calcicola]|uniref:Uncharacterized protein n=1 Tax=Vermiconidia calcicola TaxID=1690605 RepID=A0ACC3NJ11_9PEZI|nr:hypothetical protein LTR37_005748 [Vermiconidia calcicola]